VHIGKPPHLLVVSPRDRIESIREVTLLPDMSEEDMANIEAEIDSLGVSSLVVGLGGMSTYPSYVTDKADVRFMLDTAGEEWLHQYLSFTPLGFLYVLDLAGIRRDYDIATMNETVASMISKEIGAIIYEQYYATVETDDAEQAADSGFDFNKEMREIRKAVDDYLARGITDSDTYALIQGIVNTVPGKGFSYLRFQMSFDEFGQFRVLPLPFAELIFKRCQVSLPFSRPDGFFFRFQSLNPLYIGKIYSGSIIRVFVAATE
ncbi:unnamed protein product, partial [marine sediment metagenome]